MLKGILTAALLAFASLQPSTPGDEQPSTLATMLQAKGISDAAPIRNILVREDARGEHDTYLFSPGKGWWIFHDFRPGVLGASIEVDDLEHHHAWRAYINKGGRTPAQEIPIEDGYRQRIAVIYLAQCEQSPLHAVTTQNSSEDSFAADCAGYRFHFHLDRKTHLPSAVLWTIPRDTAHGGKPDFTGDTIDIDSKLTKYTNVAGLQVPSRVTFRSMRFSSQVQLNVDVPPGLFSRPPKEDVQNGDDWRHGNG